jgi:hypothetical protein
MSRWRIVSEQSNGHGPAVSTVVLSADEAVEQLDAEAEMHRMAGWLVTVGDDVIVCRWARTGLVRTIRRVEYDAMADVIS